MRVVGGVVYGGVIESNNDLENSSVGAGEVRADQKSDPPFVTRSQSGSEPSVRRQDERRCADLCPASVSQR